MLWAWLLLGVIEVRWKGVREEVFWVLDLHQCHLNLPLHPFNLTYRTWETWSKGSALTYHHHCLSLAAHLTTGSQSSLRGPLLMGARDPKTNQPSMHS